MKYVPLISSSIAGPAGIKHLPRLWQKVSLEVTGQLHDEYPGIGAGYDAMLLDALKVDHAAFKSFVTESKPTYVACEKWLLENGTPCPCAIATFNHQVDQYHHDDATRNSILEAAGLPLDSAIPDAPSLNNLDDWSTFHQEVIQGA